MKEIKKIKRSALIRIALVAFAIYVTVMLINAQVQINNRNAEIERVKTQITVKQIENESLRAFAEADNEDYMEQIAREKLDYAKPGEKIFVDIS